MNEELVLKSKSQIHLARKAMHVIAGLTIISIYLLSSVNPRFFAYCLIGISIFLFIFELVRTKSESLGQVFVRTGGMFIRESERNAPTPMPLFFLGIALSFLLFQEQIAVLATLILTISDPVASFMGIKFGRKPLLNDRTFEGSYALFLTSFFIITIYGFLYFPLNIKIIVFALIIALMSAFIELYSKRIDDNFTLSFISAVSMYVVNLVVQIF